MPVVLDESAWPIVHGNVQVRFSEGDDDAHCGDKIEEERVREGGWATLVRGLKSDCDSGLAARLTTHTLPHPPTPPDNDNSPRTTPTSASRSR